MAGDPEPRLTASEKVEAAAFTTLLALGMMLTVAWCSAWLWVLLRWMGW